MSKDKAATPKRKTKTNEVTVVAWFNADGVQIDVYATEKQALEEHPEFQNIEPTETGDRAYVDRSGDPAVGSILGVPDVIVMMGRREIQG